MACAGAELGFVFCVRVGNNPQPLFRWVGMNDLDDPRTVSDTLACLAHAHASADTTRELEEETHQLAYSAWAVARERIYDEWMVATDHRNLQPEVPKAMRDAAAIVTTQEPAGMSRREADELVKALSAPYPPRIQGVFRAIVRTDEPDQHRANRIAEEAARLGLEPSPPPEALPVIEQDDIHLVCWQSITPAHPPSTEPALAVDQADLLAPQQTVLA